MGYFDYSSGRNKLPDAPVLLPVLCTPLEAGEGVLVLRPERRLQVRRIVVFGEKRGISKEGWGGDDRKEGEDSTQLSLIHI